MQLTINIDPTNAKALALLNYIRTLDFITFEENPSGTHESNFNIPDWHKKLLDERLADHEKNPEQVLDFDTVMNEIDKKL